MKVNMYTVMSMALLVLGCDFLDNKPKGLTIPGRCEDYEKLLNAQSLLNIQGEEVVYFSDDVKLLGKEETASNYIFLNKSDAIRNIFSFQPGQIYTDGTNDNIWNNAYGRLFTYNTVIDEVMDSEGEDDRQKLRIKSEALFARAYEYFILVNLYGKHYNPLTADKDLGIPYIKEASINKKYVRNSVKEVYEFIISDLTEAEAGLSEVVPNRTHPDRAAINSFYARLYLYMGNYEKALVFANKALKSNDVLLNLNDYEKREGVTWGRVHLLGNKSVHYPDVNHPEANYLKFFDGFIQGEVMLSDEMRDLFKKRLVPGQTDLRKEFFYAEDSVNLGRKDEFPGECAYVFYADLNVGFTSVENYLIAAECEARVGAKERAMDLLNKVRANRIKNYTPMAISSREDVLLGVLEERRLEFAMKGGFRLFDLKRLNREEKFKKTVVHKVDGNIYTLPPADIRYIFPVNREILNFNPDLPVYNR